MRLRAVYGHDGAADDRAANVVCLQLYYVCVVGQQLRRVCAAGLLDGSHWLELSELAEQSGLLRLPIQPAVAVLQVGDQRQV